VARAWQRTIHFYLPLWFFLLFLLFPFYWMLVTAIKPDSELISARFNPLWVNRPTLDHFRYLLTQTDFPKWLWNTLIISVGATAISLIASLLAAYAIQRLRFRGSATIGISIFMTYLVPQIILFIPLAAIIFRLGLWDKHLALILVYPTFLIPFGTWLLMGYFKSIPHEIEECAMIDGASRIQCLLRITLPLSLPGILSVFIFSFTLSWNEFLYALVFLSSPQNKTIPIGVVTELIRGDIYMWGPLMAGALLGSVPVALAYSFFVEHYVAGLTGALKE